MRICPSTSVLVTLSKARDVWVCVARQSFCDSCEVLRIDVVAQGLLSIRRQVGNMQLVSVSLARRHNAGRVAELDVYAGEPRRTTIQMIGAISPTKGEVATANS